MKEYLEPAAGSGEVIFPPTFAPPEDQRDAGAGYIIDGEGGTSVCILDSVGSQANRLEPVFKSKKYRDLVPQVEIRIKDRAVSLLEAGHRAADALVRSTELGPEVEKAFRACAIGDAEPLARIAPTSLVFGAWDSRGTQAKVPRLVDSTIRAFGVRKLNRAAQYFSALEKDEVEELLETDTQKQRKPLSKAGFLDAPSGRTHGGVIVEGDIVRTTIINLTALRALGASTAEREMSLRRYILGLALIAAIAPADLFLRQGCLLVGAQDKAPDTSLVYRDGRREHFDLAPAQVEEFAGAAAQTFVVGGNRNVDFDSKVAKKLVKDATKAKEDA
jgi:CRISPR-associated protein Csb1